MQTYELLVKNRAIVPNSDDMTLVRTSIGIDQIHVLFDNAEWLDFPITVTFSQGEDSVTKSLVISSVDGTGEWVAQSTCLIPHEVIDMVGPIKVTFQGTSADGNHIITAAASPLSVEEAGDVTQGTMPEDVPTLDEWNQAYADAMAAANEAASIIENLQAQLDLMIANAQGTIADYVEETRVPASKTRAGIVIPGSGIDVTDEGVISVNSSYADGMSTETKSVIQNLQLLAAYCFDTTFNADGELQDDAKLKITALPFAIADEVAY